mgnify:CR=1 FL=1
MHSDGPELDSYPHQWARVSGHRNTCTDIHSTGETSRGIDKDGEA